MNEPKIKILELQIVILLEYYMCIIIYFKLIPRIVKMNVIVT